MSLKDDSEMFTGLHHSYFGLGFIKLIMVMWSTLKAMRTRKPIMSYTTDPFVSASLVPVRGGNPRAPPGVDPPHHVSVRPSAVRGRHEGH